MSTAISSSSTQPPNMAYLHSNLILHTKTINYTLSPRFSRFTYIWSAPRNKTYLQTHYQCNTLDRNVNYEGISTLPLTRQLSFRERYACIHESGLIPWFEHSKYNGNGILNCRPRYELHTSVYINWIYLLWHSLRTIFGKSAIIMLLIQLPFPYNYIRTADVKGTYMRI